MLTVAANASDAPSRRAVCSRGTSPSDRCRDRDQPCGQQRTASAAADREHAALCQQLPCEAQPSRAERDAHRHLLLPRRRPRQQQVRDVAAADQQHQHDGGKQDEQRGADVQHQLAVQRPHAGAMSLAHRRQFRRDARGNRVHLALRGLDGETRLQARHHEEIVTTAIEMDRLGNRRPDVRPCAARAGRKLEVGRHDADD